MPITSPTKSYWEKCLDYLPVTGLFRAAERGLKSKDNPEGATNMELSAHAFYTVVFPVSLFLYCNFGMETGQWNPIKQPSAIVQRNEEIARQKRADEEGRIQGRERLLKLMIKDNDFSGNGSLDSGIEQDKFIENLSRSDF